MENMQTLYDEYPGLEKFLSKMGPHAKHDNLYIIQCEDMDGNITDTKYGLNLIPDVYFNSLDYFSHGEYQRQLWNLRIVQDDGNIPSASTDMGLVYQEGSKYLSVTCEVSASNYAATYDSETGIVSARFRLGSFVYDYNYSSIKTDLHINKMILEHNSRALAEVTIYDEDGNFSGFTKHLNERVTITLFGVGYVHEDVFNQAYANGIYLIINPVYCASICNQNSYLWAQWGSKYMHYIGSWKSSYKRYDGSYANTFNNWTYVTCYNMGNSWDTVTGFRNGASDKNITEHSMFSHDSWLMVDPRVYVSKCIFRSKYNTTSWGSVDENLNNSFWLFTEEKLDEPEELVIDPVYTDSSLNSSLKNAFGKMHNTDSWAGYIPCVDFHLTAVKAWNHATHTWDIDIPFIDEPDAYYDNPFTNDSLMPFWMHGPGISNSEQYIRIHPHAATKPLTKLSFSSGSSPLYATDKFWDPSTWQRIYDPANIPVELQKKRYYFTNGGTNDTWYPTFEQDVHRLDTESPIQLSGLPETTDFRKSDWMGFIAVGRWSAESTWFLAQEHVYIPESSTVWGTPERYRIDGPETRSGKATAPSPNVFRFAYEDKLLVASEPGSTDTMFPSAVRIYDIANRVVGVSIPYTDIQLDVGAKVTRAIAMVSTSRNGYFVITNRNSNIANIIDVANDTMTKLENVKNCYAIDYTDYCVYNDTTSEDTITYVVYDMRQNTIHATFKLPDTHITPNSIFGYRDHVYIKTTNGSTTFLDLYDISSGTIELCPSTTIYAYGASTKDKSTTIQAHFNGCGGVVYADDIMVIWSNDTSTGYESNISQYSYYINYDEPTTVRQMYLLGTDISYYGDIKSYNDQNLLNTFNSYRLGMFTHVMEDPNNTSSQSRIYLMNPSSPTYYSGSSIGFNADNGFMVSDLGFLADFKKSGGHEYVKNHFAKNDGRYYGGVYFNNGIILFDHTGTTATWYDIENFLPHQITGTTRTIQCWNNPVSIYGKNFTFYKTNRPDINTFQEPTRWAGMVWGSCVYAAKDYNGNAYPEVLDAKEICGLITPPHQDDYLTFNSGDIVRCEAKLKPEYDVAPNTGTIRFRIGYFKANPKKMPYERDTFTGYAAADGTATITVGKNVPVATILVSTSLGDTAWQNGGRVCLSPVMFEYIKVWVNDVLIE